MLVDMTEDGASSNLHQLQSAGNPEPESLQVPNYTNRVQPRQEEGRAHKAADMKLPTTMKEKGYEEEYNDHLWLLHSIDSHTCMTKRT